QTPPWGPCTTTGPRHSADGIGPAMKRGTSVVSLCVRAPVSRSKVQRVGGARDRTDLTPFCSVMWNASPRTSRVNSGDVFGGIMPGPEVEVAKIVAEKALKDLGAAVS